MARRVWGGREGRGRSDGDGGFMVEGVGGAGVEGEIVEESWRCVRDALFRFGWFWDAVGPCFTAPSL